MFKQSLGVSMKNTCARITLIFFTLAVQAVLMPTAALATGGGGGGGGDQFPFGPTTPDPFAGQGVGFGASPNAVAAWYAAGGKQGTGLSFQNWFKKAQIELETKQGQLEWDSKKAGWAASFWNVLFGTAKVADTAGQVSQFGLNFVPGLGKVVNVGLDAARGAGEGYAGAVDKGMSQSEALKTGAVTGTAMGLLTSFANKFGFAKDAGKAVEAVQAAKTAAQITRTNQKLGVALVGTTVQEGIKTAIGSSHVTSVVNNSSPQAQVYKE